MKIPGPRAYPRTLKFGDEEYTIRFVRSFKDDPKQVGLCCPEKREIVIKLGESREETFKTLIHEVCHGLIEFEHDIKIKHKLIYRLENVILQFLVDNF